MVLIIFTLITFIKGNHSVTSLLRSDRSPANSGGQPCKKHELYVSFSDLGWKVSFSIQLL